MENENIEELLDYEDGNTFGPHVKEIVEYGRTYTKHFFTLSYKDQDVSKNKTFIQWKKDMKKVNDLVIHCPSCSAYFPNAAYTNCRCKKCGFFFVLDVINLIVQAKLALNGGKLLFHFLVSKNMEIIIF